MKFRPLSIACVLTTAPIYSDWSPSAISATPFLPFDPQFKELEGSVFNYLRNSWVTEEKAQLIMELIALTKPKICVDIGSFSGSSALPIAATLKYLKNGKVYLIDAWSAQESIKNIPVTDPNHEWWSSLNMQPIKSQCLAMIREWALEPYCQIFHAPSEQVAFQIDQIDFLHLDGNFSEAGSLLDVALYVPKVKSGGYILLSNAFLRIDQMLTKKATIWHLYQECELVTELENGNTMLFKKQ